MKKQQQRCCSPHQAGMPPGAGPVAPGMGALSLTPWCIGRVDTAVGPIPRVADTLRASDRRGAVRVRVGIGRDRYRIEPGLYALGTPDRTSPVFVSANYKLSFDHLRRALRGRPGWILVLDTDGINVWCAAGKGTFGTVELVHRVRSTRLGEVVEHRRLIVPQLGATGVAAHLVEQESGFRVVYGPVRADDLPAFLDAGCRTTKGMRRVRFSLMDRLVVTPHEMILWGKWILPVVLALILLKQFRMAGTLFAAFLAGTLFAPLLLPVLPGRAFSIKGIILGAIVGLVPAWRCLQTGDVALGAACLLASVSVTSFLSLNFTGCSTFTSLTGVHYETVRAVPLQVLALIAAAALWMWSAGS